MADESLPTKRISELTPAEALNDADILPLSTPAGDGAYQTQSGTLADVRSLINFDQAVDSPELGLSDTSDGQIFHVWTSPKKLQVVEYANVAGTAIPTGKSFLSINGIAELNKHFSTMQRSGYTGGDIGPNGEAYLVYADDDGRPLFGYGGRINGDIFKRIELTEKAIGSLLIYSSLSAGSENSLTDTCFIVEANEVDNLKLATIFRKNSDGNASPILRLISDNQLWVGDSRSGYSVAIVSEDGQSWLSFDEDDGRPRFGFAGKTDGDIFSRLAKIESQLGHNKVILQSYTFADSIGAGTGGIPFPTQLAGLIGDDFTAINYGLGGQKSGQIAMRMGAIPTYITVNGNAIPAANASVAITQFNGASATAAPAYPSQDRRILSTNSDNTTRTLEGWICGVKCRITRTASGDHNNTKAEVYTLTALEGTGVRCLPGSLFTPEYSLQNLSESELWICAGINDFRAGASNASDYDDDVNSIINNLDAMISFGERKGMNILLFSLSNGDYPSEYLNGIRYQRILDVNAHLSTSYPDYYVRGNNGQDVRETLVSSFNNNNAQDIIDFDNDIIPSTLRSDERHPNTAGYGVYAAVGYQFRERRGL